MNNKNVMQFPVKQTRKLKKSIEISDKTMLSEDTTLKTPKSHKSQVSNQLISPSSISTGSPQKTSPSFKDIFSEHYISLTEDKRHLSNEDSFLLDDQNAFPPYFNEINICKGEIKTLKNKLEQIQKNPIKSLKKNKHLTCHSTFNTQLEDQKLSLKKQYKLALSRMKAEIFQEFQKEFEGLHKKTLASLKAEHRVKLKEEMKQAEDQFAYELAVVEAEFEEKLVRKIREEKESNERLISILRNENAELRSENKTLKEKSESLQKKMRSFEEFEYETRPCRNKYCQEVVRNLSEDYEKLQEDHKVLSLSKEKRLCGNCKAFIKVETDIVGQIGRLRDYLGINSN